MIVKLLNNLNKVGIRVEDKIEPVTWNVKNTNEKILDFLLSNRGVTYSGDEVTLYRFADTKEAYVGKVGDTVFILYVLSSAYISDEVTKPNKTVILRVSEKGSDFIIASLKNTNVLNMSEIFNTTKYLPLLRAKFDEGVNSSFKNKKVNYNLNTSITSFSGLTWVSFTARTGNSETTLLFVHPGLISSSERDLYINETSYLAYIQGNIHKIISLVTKEVTDEPFKRPNIIHVFIKVRKDLSGEMIITTPKYVTEKEYSYIPAEISYAHLIEML